MRYWGKGHFWLLGMKLVVHGTPPAPPYYLVSNHVSYIDIMLFGGHLGCCFVSKGSVARWPLVGFIATSMQVLFIDRKNKRDTVRINELIQHTLEQGDGIVVFAESRIFRGLDVAPFKSALIEPAVANNLPVHYATISYETPETSPPASEIIGWWRPETFLHHISRLLRHRSFTANLHYGASPIEGEDRKLLAKQLHQAVQENFVPMP